MSQIDLSSVIVILPAFNEEKTIPDVVARVKRQQVAVLVVDDGSQDGTLVAAEKAGAITLRLSSNQGKGAALVRGFEHVRDGMWKWVAILDSDGQHLPEDLPVFFEACATGRYDFINGSRLEDPKGMSWLRYRTNLFMSGLISLLVRQPVRDVQCGYKMMSVDYVRNAVLSATRYEIEDDLVLEAGRLGSRIGHVRVQSYYAGEVSRIRPVRDSVRFFWFIAKWCFKNGLGKKSSRVLSGKNPKDWTHD